MTLEQFKKEKVEAMKNHDKDTVSALNVIITKIMSLTIEKRATNETVSEADIDNIIKKVEKELIEEKDGFEKAGRTENVVALSKQIEIIKKYYYHNELLEQHSSNARALYENLFNADSSNRKLLDHIIKISKSKEK